MRVVALERKLNLRRDPSTTRPDALEISAEEKIGPLRSG
jgi:hypothetical protein